MGGYSTVCYMYGGNIVLYVVCMGGYSTVCCVYGGW